MGGINSDEKNSVNPASTIRQWKYISGLEAVKQNVRK
jgi:hypothetical protein